MLLVKLLKKLGKQFYESFPDEKRPDFGRITERGFDAPLLYRVKEVFGKTAEIEVHEKALIGSESEVFTERLVEREVMVAKQEPGNARLAEAQKAKADQRTLERNNLGKRTEEAKSKEVRKEEAKKEEHKKEEVKKEEGKKEEGKKEEGKKEETRKEDGSKDTKPETLGKKKGRYERPKDIPQPNKHPKLDEDKKPAIANEHNKREVILSSSSEDSDADIFTKDEKKPMLSKANIFRNN